MLVELVVEAVAAAVAAVVVERVEAAAVAPVAAEEAVVVEVGEVVVGLSSDGGLVVVRGAGVVHVEGLDEPIFR